MKKTLCFTLFCLFGIVTGPNLSVAFGSTNDQNRSLMEHFTILYHAPSTNLTGKIALADSLIILSKKLGLNETQLFYMQEKSSLCQQTGDYYSAFYNYRQIIQYLEEECEPTKVYDSILRKSYSSLILNATQAGLIDDGLNAAYVFLKKYPDLSDAELARVYSNLGALYMEAGQMEEAHRHHLKAIEHQSKSQDSNSILIYNNYAGWFFMQGQIDSALHYLLKAKYNSPELQNNDSELYYHNLACIYEAMGRKDMAYQYYEKSLECVSDENSEKSFRRAQILMSLGLFYLRDSNYVLAEERLLDALESAQKIGFKNIEYQARAAYAALLHLKQADRKAYGQLLQAYEQRDTVLRIENDKKIFQQKKDFETYRMQTDLQLAELNNVKKKLTIAILSVFTLILCGCLGFLLYLLRKEKKDNRKLNQSLSDHTRKTASDLEVKNNLIISNVMSNSHKDEVLHTIQLSAEALEKAIGQADTDTLNRYCRDILKNIRTCRIENRWEDFRQEFENAYPHFYEILEEQVGPLTKGEKRLTALLAAGLNAKEIAEIINRTPSSVETFIYRLRKKINLNREVRTNDFFEEIKRRAKEREK